MVRSFACILLVLVGVIFTTSKRNRALFAIHYLSYIERLYLSFIFGLCYCRAEIGSVDSAVLTDRHKDGVPAQEAAVSIAAKSMTQQEKVTLFALFMALYS